MFFKGQGQKKDAKSMRKTMFALVILLWTSSVSAQIGVFDYYDSFGETGSHYRGKYIGELSTYHHQVSICDFWTFLNYWYYREFFQIVGLWISLCSGSVHNFSKRLYL